MFYIVAISFFKSLKQLSRGLLWTGWWFCGAITLGWYLLHELTGDRLGPVRLVSYFMPWLLVGLLPGLLLAGLARRGWLAAALALPTLLIGLTFAPLFLPRSSTVLAGGLSLKVMSYNVLYRNKNVVGMARVIRQEAPDILLLQEMSEGTLKALMAELGSDPQPWYVAYEPDMVQAILSRYPVTPQTPAPDKGRAQKVLIKTPAGPVAVWNVHSNVPLPWQRQYRQFVMLTEDITVVDGPLIVGGDFNTTDQSETYRLVNQRLHNAHWEAGWGFGFSFPAHRPTVRGVPVPTPVIRIDHIFYNDYFFSTRARTLADSGGSDHLPVVAELSFTR